MASVNTVLDALIACGVDNVAMFMEETQAQCIAEDLFDNSFACMDMTFKELDEHFKTYSDLTVAQGQIRLRPGTRKNIKAFVQWAHDELRLGRNPSATPFQVNQVSDLIRRYKTHEKFQANSRTLAEAARPDKFKETTKWEDWRPTFIKYLHTTPGRDGVPLKQGLEKLYYRFRYTGICGIILYQNRVLKDPGYGYQVRGRLTKYHAAPSRLNN